MQVFWPNFEKRGPVVVVVVEVWTHRVLMVAYTDEAGFRETLATGEAVFYSTSRKERWKKGEMSGNSMKVLDIFIDCDNDALLYAVETRGPACHTFASTCFFDSCIHGRRVSGLALSPRQEVERVVREVDVHPTLAKRNLIY
jgi:phosphoribosyl-AMP cyclohydrolase